MKNSSLVFVAIALFVGAVFGYVIGKQGGAAQPTADRDSIAGGGANSGLSGLGASDRTGDTSGSGAGDDQGAGDELFGGLSKRVLGLLEKGDVEAALKAVFDAPGQMERMDALLQLVRRLDAPGIEVALAKVRGMPRGMDMFMSASLLMARYADISPEKALGFVSGSSGFERMMGTSSILRSWAAKDPKAAGAYLVGTVLEEGGDDWQLRRTAASVASEWVRQDPQAALAWAKGLPDEVRGEALETVIERLATNDPSNAAAVAMGLAEKDRGEALKSIAEQWSRTDPQAATAWADGLDGEERSQALEEALQGWASNDPDGATAYLETITDAEEKDSLLPDVAGRWARRDADSAASAAEWLGEQDDGEGKVRATGEVINAWMDNDPAAASTWLGAQPAGAAKDRGIVAMLGERALREEPATAVAWADSISDVETRGQQVVTASQRWLVEDREAALDYLGSSASLSETQKSELIEMTPEQLKRANEQSSRRRRF